MAKKVEQWKELKARSWYLLQNGEEVGPLTETALRQLIEQGTVADGAAARQGDSRYFPVAEIRNLFDALSTDGWYVLQDGSTYGPYLAERLEALMTSGFFSPRIALVRHGKTGDWATWTDALRSSRKNIRDQDRPDEDFEVTHPAANSPGSAVAEPGEAGTTRKASRNDIESEAVARGETPTENASTTEPAQQATFFGGLARRFKPADKEGSEDGAKQEAESKHVTCKKCGRRYPKSRGECSHCARAAEKERRRKQKQFARKEKAFAQSADNDTGNLFIVCVALGASGYFISKWLVASVLWSDFHPPGEQAWGWFCLLIAVVLTVTGVLVIYSDPDRRTEPKLWISGIGSLLLVGFGFYLAQHGRLNQAEQQLEQQNEIWAEVMLDGGYDDWPDEE